jgi:hypothetical protein
MREIIGDTKEEILAINISKSYSKNLITLFFDYYRFHIPNFKELKSIEVIESLWS